MTPRQYAVADALEACEPCVHRGQCVYQQRMAAYSQGRWRWPRNLTRVDFGPKLVTGIIVVNPPRCTKLEKSNGREERETSRQTR